VSENLQDFAAEHPENWAELWIAGGSEVEGIDRMGMPAYGDQFSPEQIASIVAYLKSLE
jgi:mono/diheme cytochrome c family protein